MSYKGMTAIVDCNSFYCACERLFKPSLLNKPVVVLSNNDGCIVSRTDEAKALGIGMAGPYYQNKEVIEKYKVAVFSSNYSLYGDLSMRVMDTLRAIAGRENVEVYSVDEAFVNLDEIPDLQLHAVIQQLKEQTEQWTGIQVSVGVAPTKVLSKVANRLAKKNKSATKCVVVLDTEEKIREALQRTPVSDIWGIGRRYAFTLKEVYNIQTAWELSKLNEEWGRKHLGGVTGVRLLKELKGFRCMELKDPLETKKMIATTRMFGKPVYTIEELKEAVATYTSRAAEKLRRQMGAAQMIHVFLVSKDIKTIAGTYQPETRHRYTTLPIATSSTHELLQYALPLTDALYRNNRHYIKAGVMLSQIVPDASIQGNLFAPLTEQRQRLLMQTLDNINCSMRDDAIKYVATGLKRNWKMRQELRSKRYTTRWEELFEIH